MDNDGICQSCPEGADCPEAGSSLESLNLKGGWFRFTPKSTETYACPKPNDCWGGNSTGNALCSTSSHGHLCNTCRPGFYMRDAVSSCVACNNVKDLWWLPPLILVTVLALIAVVAYHKRKNIKAW